MFTKTTNELVGARAGGCYGKNYLWVYARTVGLVKQYKFVTVADLIPSKNRK